jgi:hypothetical protein
LAYALRITPHGGFNTTRVGVYVISARDRLPAATTTSAALRRLCVSLHMSLHRLLKLLEGLRVRLCELLY